MIINVDLKDISLYDALALLTPESKLTYVVNESAKTVNVDSYKVTADVDDAIRDLSNKHGYRVNKKGDKYLIRTR